MTGPELRTLRKSLGLTQAGLAAELGISVSQLYNYEHGADRRTDKPCPVPRLVELAMATILTHLITSPARRAANAAEMGLLAKHVPASRSAAGQCRGVPVHRN